MTLFKYIATLVVGVVIGVGGYAYFGPTQAAPTSNDGTSLGGIDISTTQAIVKAAGYITRGSTFVSGAPFSTTTTSIAFGTTTGATLNNYNVLVFTPNVSSATTTLDLQANWTFLKTVGDKRVWVLENGTSTAGITVGIGVFAGAGINILGGTLNNIQLAKNTDALLSCFRRSTTAIDCIVGTNVEGDSVAQQ